MTTKEAILSSKELSGDHSIMARVDWRNSVDAYKEHYTPEQIAYLFEHDLLREYVKTGASWERPWCEYWEFTDKGKRLRKWYNRQSLLSYLYYELHLFKIKYYWQKLRIAFGHHYAWQDYEYEI